MARPHTFELRVRYSECDPQGIVFNANYFSWFDQAITELWRAASDGYESMVERGVDIVVAEASARFLGSARPDDVVELEVGVSSLGRTSLGTRHRVLRSGELLVEGALRHVFVDRENWQKTPIPDDIRAWLEAYRVEDER